jgi:hypothetical protein
MGEGHALAGVPPKYRRCVIRAKALFVQFLEVNATALVGRTTAEMPTNAGATALEPGRGVPLAVDE